MQREKIIFSWSGGKDSALALYEILRSGRYEIVALLTTVSMEFDRIVMHGVRKTLLDAQAQALGIPSEPIYLPASPTNDQYERALQAALERYKAQGVRRCAFGDIFLEDLKKYRDEKLAACGMEGIYPIWKRDSRDLIEQFLSLQFKAVLSCVDTQALQVHWAGRDIDASFLRDLPPAVDPCGENGEYHSYVYEGPIYSAPIRIQRGDRIVMRNRFAYCDLLPAAEEVPA